MIPEDLIITRLVEEYCFQQISIIKEHTKDPVTHDNSVEQALLVGQAEGFLKVQKFINNYMKTRIAESENYKNWLESA